MIDVEYRGGETSLATTARGLHTFNEFNDPFFLCWYEAMIVAAKSLTR